MMRALQALNVWIIADSTALKLNVVSFQPKSLRWYLGVVRRLVQLVAVM